MYLHQRSGDNLKTQECTRYLRKQLKQMLHLRDLHNMIHDVLDICLYFDYVKKRRLYNAIVVEHRWYSSRSFVVDVSTIYDSGLKD